MLVDLLVFLIFTNDLLLAMFTEFIFNYVKVVDESNQRIVLS